MHNPFGLVFIRTQGTIRPGIARLGQGLIRLTPYPTSSPAAPPIDAAVS